MSTQIMILSVSLVILSGIMFVFGGALAGLSVIPLLIMGVVATNGGASGQEEEQEGEK